MAAITAICNLFDVARKKEKQITLRLRALDPEWSADGKHIICITQKDGTDNLTLVTLDGKSRLLTKFENGESLSSPTWSPDGKTVVLSQGRQHDRDLVRYSFSDSALTKLISDQGDARDPVFSPRRAGSSFFPGTRPASLTCTAWMLRVVRPPCGPM